MLCVHVSVHVVPDRVEEFRAASVLNATASRDEPDVLRFDVLQDEADSAHFVLVEVYRDADAAVAHKETTHYGRWRDAVAEMMARPRSAEKFTAVDPMDPAAWAVGR